MLIRAYAKVNLALAVGPPLPADAAGKGGFHPIASWMHAIDLHDQIELEATGPRGGPGRSTCRVLVADDAPRPTPIDWPLELDLAVRAHRLLEAHVGSTLPVHLIVRKRTPVGGGLGGGSADAAAVLRGVDALFDLNLGESALATLAAKLGSDIAFFIDDAAPLGAPPRPALVSGLGDRIRRTPRRRVQPIVLIVPAFGCPTGPVYKAFDAFHPGPLREREVADLFDADGPINTASLFNDLTAPAEHVAAPLGPLRERAAELVASPVHVTGSGSTLFALPSDEHQAQSWAETLRRELKVAVINTRLV